MRALACRLKVFAAAASAAAAVACGHADAATLLSAHLPAIVAQHGATITGAPDPAFRMTLDIALPMRKQAELKALLKQIYDPTGPLYRHYLTVPEFTRRFGPKESDYKTAVKFFEHSGLNVTALSANRYLISVEASVADIERVFHVRLNFYRHPSEARNFLSPDREPTMDLNVPVLHVSGLDDFTLPTPRLLAPKSGGAKFHGTGSGPKGYYIGSDMRAAYYGGSALDGAGQSLGLMEFRGYRFADVQLYYTTVGQTLNIPINGISVDGRRVECESCNDGEQVLDIVYAASMAPGLAQMQVYVGKTGVAILNRMATDNTSKQLSTSWGWKGEFRAEDPIYQEMAAQGQTFLTASGDFSSLRKSGPWPEEDANLTAVGGTDLITAGPGGGYVSETGWEDSAGGPSLDKHILIEPYQLPFITEKNGGSDTRRNVPDIGANANFTFFICYDNKCNGGWGGTSFSSPILAGFVALANQQAAGNGKPPVGFLNPTIYTLAHGNYKKDYTRLLHDAIGGTSGHFTAVKKYDLVTGLGSPNGQNFIDALTE